MFLIIITLMCFILFILYHPLQFLAPPPPTSTIPRLRPPSTPLIHPSNTVRPVYCLCLFVIRCSGLKNEQKNRYTSQYVFSIEYLAEINATNKIKSEICARGLPTLSRSFHLEDRYGTAYRYWDRGPLLKLWSTSPSLSSHQGLCGWTVKLYIQSTGMMWQSSEL